MARPKNDCGDPCCDDFRHLGTVVQWGGCWQDQVFPEGHIGFRHEMKRPLSIKRTHRTLIFTVVVG